MNKILFSKMDGKNWFCYACKFSAFLHVNKKDQNSYRVENQCFFASRYFFHPM